MGTDDLFPLANPICLLFREQNQSEFVFNFFEQYRDSLSRNWLLVGFRPFLDGNDPFALVSDIDQNFIAFNANNDPFQHGVDVVAFVLVVVFLQQFQLDCIGIGQRQAKRGFEILITHIEFTNQVPINHSDPIMKNHGTVEEIVADNPQLQNRRTSPPTSAACS